MAMVRHVGAIVPTVLMADLIGNWSRLPDRTDEQLPAAGDEIRQLWRVDE